MKIVIIKLGAKGDVVRTLPLLLAIKEKYFNSEITWITKKSSREILETSPHINNILTIPIEYELGSFDILYNFDIEETAAELATKINAEKKYGFFLDQGYPTALNFPAEYYLNTLFDDEFKKNNKKSYQQIMFDLAELPYKNQHHPIYLTDNEKQYAENFLKENNINRENLIGIHLGSSPRWPSKKWHIDNIKKFITKAKNKGYEILLFAGPDEKDYYENLVLDLKNQNIRIYTNNPYNTDKEFFSLINICKKVISGDSFALHVALALKKSTIGLFFCTPPDEVEDYGILKKIISPMLYDFFPEKMNEYSEELTKSISAEEVLNELENIEIGGTKENIEKHDINLYKTRDFKKEMHSEKIKELISDSIEAIKTVDNLVEDIEKAAEMMIDSLNQGNKILTCGNGGSAAQAQHLASELIGRFEAQRKAISSISLTTDTSNLTSIGNDYGFISIFKRQIEAIGKENDVLFCFTTSGDSPNIIEAINTAKLKKMKIISLLGREGGKTKGTGNIDIIVPLKNTARIQECHTLILHILSKLIEDSFLNQYGTTEHSRSIS